MMEDSRRVGMKGDIYCVGRSGHNPADKAPENYRWVKWGYDLRDAVKYPSNSLFFKVRIVPPRIFVLILIDDPTGPEHRIRQFRVHPVH